MQKDCILLLLLCIPVVIVSSLIRAEVYNKDGSSIEIQCILHCTSVSM